MKDYEEIASRIAWLDPQVREQEILKELKKAYEEGLDIGWVIEQDKDYYQEMKND